MTYTISYNAPALPERIVKDYFDRNDIAYKYGANGEVELTGKLSADKFSNMQQFLEQYGIEILHDEKTFFVQRIKNILTELAYGDKPLSKTLSCHLSETLGFSYVYIASCFERGTAFSIEQYLILVKIERAKRLIIEDALTIKQIADLLHYCSPGHLCKQFKKTTGISVTSFRKIIAFKRGFGKSQIMH